MNFNIIERLEKRKNDFMRPEFFNENKSVFAVNLRKNNRMKQFKKHREDIKNHLNMDISEAEYFPDLSSKSFSEKLKMLLSIVSVDNREQEKIFKIIRAVCIAEKTFELLLYPEYINSLKVFTQIKYPDNISYIVLLIFTKLLSGNAVNTKNALNLIGLSTLLDSIHLEKLKSTEQTI